MQKAIFSDTGFTTYLIDMFAFAWCVLKSLQSPKIHTRPESAIQLKMLDMWASMV